MPPNTGSGSVLDHVQYKHKQVANPYSEAKSACFEECPGTSGSGHTRDEEPQEQLMDNVVRVTTRARLTYELYKYTKNAMLIVNSTPPWARDDRDEEVEELKSTFEKFGFEVDVASIDVNNRDLYEVCGQFFERDFTEYGSVALVVLTPMSASNEMTLPGLEGRNYQETVIFENFGTNRNPTLEDKPKIYITEAGCGVFASNMRYDEYNGVSRDVYSNVIGFCTDKLGSIIAKSLYMQELMWDEVYERARPLIFFCKKLAAMGDNVNLPEIIAQTKKETDNKHSLMPESHRKTFVAPMEIVNTLTKELYFTRVGEN